MFKKKDAIVKDSEKSEVAAKKAVTKAAKKNKKSDSGNSRKSIFSWTYQPALLALIALGLAYALVDQITLKQSEAEFNDSVEQQVLSSLVSTVDAYLELKQQSVNSLAMQASISSEALSAVWPELSAFYRIANGSLQTARQTYSDLTFASVDLMRKSLSEQRSIVEAFYNEDAWYIQIAAPVTNSETKKLSGDVVLAVFDFSALQSVLQGSELITKGSVELVSMSDRVVLSLGNRGGGSKIKRKIGTSGLAITYSPDQAQVLTIDRIMVLIILLSIGVVLAIILVVLARMNMGRIRKDILQVGQIAGKLAAGTRSKGEFSHGEFTALSQAVSEHMKQLIANSQKVEKVADKKSAPEAEKQPSEAGNSVDDDAPLFDDDVLDLDVLGESQGLEEAEGMVSEVKALDIDVPQSIFRAYDIRGIVDESLNEGLVELLGKSIASEAKLLGQKALCVGYDARHSSSPYSEALIRGILSTGLDVVNIGQVPTPVLYFSTHHFKTGSGVMITGSHNPANYNGFKIVLDGKTLCGDDIQKIYNRILLRDFEVGEGSLTECDVAQEYMDTILNDIAVAAPLKVVLDAGNGVAGRIAPQLIEELGCEVIPLHCEIDGNFPNHHPDPSKPENLTDLIAAVQEHDADIGLAFDGDADRLGVVTNTGKIIWPDRLLMLFAKDVVSRNPGADILFDVKCSRRLNGLVSSYGGRPVMWKSGHSFIKAKMKETGALLAGEMSGHIFFKERWFGFDDGLYCAARLLEVLGIEDRSSNDVFADFPEDICTPEIYLDVNDESKFKIVDSLCAIKDQFVGGNASTIDGLRVEYPNGWGLCRASNTTPSLMLRFEADDEAAMEEIKSVFRSQLQVVDPSIECNF
jgi:phosphomannomutase/phosphoglucomutase